jgi:hypothetical protein
VPPPQPAAVQGQLRKLAMMAGLTKATAEVVQLRGAPYTAVRGTKPSFTVGAKSSIAMAPNSAPQPVKLAIADDDDDLIDEDDLLTEEDRKPVAKPTGATLNGVMHTVYLAFSRRQPAYRHTTTPDGLRAGPGWHALAHMC